MELALEVELGKEPAAEVNQALLTRNIQMHVYSQSIWDKVVLNNAITVVLVCAICQQVQGWKCCRNAKKQRTSTCKAIM